MTKTNVALAVWQRNWFGIGFLISETCKSQATTNQNIMIYWGTWLRLQYLGPARVLREYLSIFVHPSPLNLGQEVGSLMLNHWFNIKKCSYLQPLEVEETSWTQIFFKYYTIIFFFSAKLLERIVFGWCLSLLLPI